MSDAYALEVVAQRADGAELENEQRGKCQHALASKGHNIAVRLAARAHDANLVVQAVDAFWRGSDWQALDSHLLIGRVLSSARVSSPNGPWPITSISVSALGLTSSPAATGSWYEDAAADGSALLLLRRRSRMITTSTATDCADARRAAALGVIAGSGGR